MAVIAFGECSRIVALDLLNSTGLVPLSIRMCLCRCLGDTTRVLSFLYVEYAYSSVFKLKSLLLINHFRLHLPSEPYSCNHPSAPCLLQQRTVLS